MALAESRGGSERVARRAVDICRNMNIAPWVALAVAEGLVPLKDAAVLDRAARCKELQSAVMDQRKALGELRRQRPYASYLLAADLVDALGADGLGMPSATEIAEGLLAAERQMGEDGSVLSLRGRPFPEYVAAARRIREIMARTGCELGMAIEVATGRCDESFARQYAEQKKRLADEESQRRTRRQAMAERYREYARLRRPVRGSPASPAGDRRRAFSRQGGGDPSAS